MNEKICKGCGQHLKEGVPFFSKPNYIKLDDDFYCEKCAKIIVDKKRKEL
jgi:hypothetical protein